MADRIANDLVSAEEDNNPVAGAVDRIADDVLKVLVILFRIVLLRNLFLPPARRSSAQNSTRRILPEQSNPLEFFSTKSLPFMPIL